MTAFFARAAIATLIGLGSIATLPVTASAAGDVNIRVDMHRPGPGHNPRPPVKPMPMPMRDRCSDGAAVIKASRAGLRQVRVVSRTPGRVVVEGVRRGHPERIMMANERGCPLILR